jgi:hypothetical protein
MAKQSALSIRVLQSIKRDIDKAAAKEHRSTSSLVEKILADYLHAAKTGQPLKYPEPGEHLAAGGNLYDLPLPTGKTLGDSTKAELEQVAEATSLVGRHMLKAAKRLKKSAGNS